MALQKCLNKLTKFIQNRDGKNNQNNSINLEINAAIAHQRIFERYSIYCQISAFAIQILTVRLKSLFTYLFVFFLFFFFKPLDYPELNIPKLDPYTSDSPFVINLRRASLPINLVANCSNIAIHGLDKIEIVQIKYVYKYSFSMISLSFIIQSAFDFFEQRNRTKLKIYENRSKRVHTDDHTECRLYIKFESIFVAENNRRRDQCKLKYVHPFHIQIFVSLHFAQHIVLIYANSQC